MNLTITPKTLHTVEILQMAFDRLAVLDLTYCYIIPIYKDGEIIGRITFSPNLRHLWPRHFQPFFSNPND